ncbi:MAG: ABC transporter permease subunit [Eubacteriales bacterium]|nr:ABC transporter permease subunit [Eubacteriales bacterium]
MKAIIRREILNYLKGPLFWIAAVFVVFGVYQQLAPYLNIHYIASEEELKYDGPEAVPEADIFEGYVPSREENRREFWEKIIQETLLAEFGMDEDEASAVIREMNGMEIKEASQYLKEQYSFYNAYYAWEDAAYHKGTKDEINSYIRGELEEHPFSWYFSRKFADFSGLFMGFAATVLLAVLFMQDVRKNTYELLHTKPVGAAQYVLGKVTGGFLVCLILLGILNLVFWAACLVCTRGNGFEIRLTDFLFVTGVYILPNMLMIVCVYMLTALLFKNPLPAVPVLILYIIYSNMGSRNEEGVYGYAWRPMAIMVRFPGPFFQITPAPGALVNQTCLLLAAGAVILIGIQLWRRRRI